MIGVHDPTICCECGAPADPEWTCLAGDYDLLEDAWHDLYYCAQCGPTGLGLSQALLLALAAKLVSPDDMEREVDRRRAMKKDN